MKKRGARSGEPGASEAVERLLAVADKAVAYLAAQQSREGRTLHAELVAAMAAVRSSGFQLPAPRSQLDHEGQS